MKNSINENGQCAGNGNGKGDGDGNNGAAHELKRKSLLNQRQGRARERRGEGVGEKSCSGAALANRKSALPKICAEWQLRVLQVERGRLGERERAVRRERRHKRRLSCLSLSSGGRLMATRDTQHAGYGSRCLRHSRQRQRRRRRQRCSRKYR